MVTRVLIDQLEIPWSLARDYVFPSLADLDPYWEISANVCSVRADAAGGWLVEMPDEEVAPLPDVTIAWLLWHVTWWWTNALRWADGAPSLGPEDVPWTGDAAVAIAQICDLHDAWIGLLESADPEQSTAAPVARLGKLVDLAAWATVELTKNVAEMGALATTQRNLTAPPTR